MINKNRLYKSIFAIGMSFSILMSTTPIRAQELPPIADNGQGQPGGRADTQSYEYTGDTKGKISVDSRKRTVKKKTVSTAAVDENAALVKNGGTLTIYSSTLRKSGDDIDSDNCNFYGINSILLAMNEGTNAYISNTKLKASSEGSNGIFATDGGTVYAYKDTIQTSGNNSRGLDATYSGTIIANAMNIQTQGDHSASIATDRGGGNISVTDSTLSTIGSGSPLLYSTGDIEVDHVTGTAVGSQIAGIEGFNTILIHNSNLKSTITKATASDPLANGIIVYQSTSGDAESTTGQTATLQIVNSKLSSSVQSGSMFYITNTNANVYVSDSSIKFDSNRAALLTVTGNDSNNWGTPGSNGGTVTFTADSQKIKGDIRVDTISRLDLYLINGTKYTGAVQMTENSVNTDKTDDPITVNVDKSSSWIVTGNSTVTQLNVAKGAKIVDKDGKAVSIKTDKKTIVKGSSDYTITVTGRYSTNVSTTKNNQTTSEYIDRRKFDSYFHTSTTFGNTSDS